MARPISGFMSNDGNFFMTLPEAQRHDAEMRIREGCLLFERPVNADTFLPVLEAMADEVGEYVRAYKEVNKHKATEDTGGISGDQSDDRRRSEDDDALEQFEASGHEPLSDMGDSP